MRVALFKIRVLRKSVSNILGPIAVTSQNIPAAPAPTRLRNTVLFYDGSAYPWEVACKVW